MTIHIELTGAERARLLIALAEHEAGSHFRALRSDEHGMPDYAATHRAAAAEAQALLKKIIRQTWSNDQ